MNNVLYPGAIDANRKGRLAPLQAIGLLPWVLFGAFLFLPGAGMMGWFIDSLINHTINGIRTIILGAIFNVGFAAAMMWFGYLLGGKLLIDMILGPVRQIEGQGMKYSSTGGRNGRIYYYSVGEQNFQIPSNRTYKVLYDANIVRAHYLPRSKTLVNLESSYSQSGASHSARRGIERLVEAEREAKRQK